MTAEDVKAPPIGRKIEIMEATWQGFRDRFDRLDIPRRQKGLLDYRRARVKGRHNSWIGSW
jgi:hypothetical protein